MDVAKLLDELGATGEDRTAVESFFSKNTKAAETVSGWRENGLRQSDYDRRMNMGKAEIEAEKARIADAERTLVSTRDTMNGQYTKALADREAAETRLAAVQARINRVATEYSVPVTEFGLDAPNPDPNNPPRREPVNNNQSNDQYVSKQDFETLTDLTKRLPMLPVTLMKLQREYHDLFGQYFDEQTVIDKALELKKPIEQVADLMFGMSTKRAEKHDAEIYAKATADADAKWKTKVSQMEVNPMRTDLAPKPGPVFELKRPEVAGVPGPRPDRTQSGVEAAVAAFREHKYAPQAPSQ